MEKLRDECLNGEINPQPFPRALFLRDFQPFAPRDALRPILAFVLLRAEGDTGRDREMEGRMQVAATPFDGRPNQVSQAMVVI